MKKIMTMAVALLASLSTIKAQQPKWLLGEGIYNMNTAVPTLSSGSGSASYLHPQTLALKADGSVSFYIHNGRLYNPSHTDVGGLPGLRQTTPYTTNTQFLNPTMIVPVPGSCSKYYVIYNLNEYITGSLGGNHELRYCVVDISTGNPVVDPSSLIVHLVGGVDYGYRWPKPLPGGAFAVSKIINTQNDRYLFTMDSSPYLTYFKVQKHLISATGISLIGTIFQSSDDVLYPTSNFNYGELELSPDQQNLALTATSGSTALLYQVKLNNYNFLSFERKAVPTSSSQHFLGLEYTSGSDQLYVSTYNGILSYIDVATFNLSGLTPFTSTVGQFTSNLELGKSGKIYAVVSDSWTSDGTLYYINPGSSPTTTNTGISTPFSGGGGPLDLQLPIQIDGDDYSNVTGVSPVVCNYNINGTPSGNTPPSFLDVYTCAPIMFYNTSTSAAEYNLVVQSCDASGTVVSGGSYLNYASGWHTNTSGHDLRSLPTWIYMGGIPIPYTPNSWLQIPTNIGYYRVALTVRNACGMVSPTKVSYIKLNAPPSPVSMNLQINQAGGGVCYTQNIAAICPNTGIYGVGFNLGAEGSTFGSNNIASYSRKLEEVDCGTGAVTSILYEDVTPVIPPSSGALYAINLNSLYIGGSPGYFATNPSLMGRCYKLTVTATNACSSASDWSYFKLAMGGYWRPGSNNPNESGEPSLGTARINSSVVSNDNLILTNDDDIRIYPNPANDNISVSYFGNKNGIATFKIYDVQGRVLIDIDNLPNNANKFYTQKINVSKLPQGLYIYKFNNGQKIKSGQLNKF